jgi:type I restriction enzyme S subunit
MKEWVPYKLKEITTKIGSGSTPTGGKEAYYQSGITLVRSLNIYDFVFELQNLAFINKAQAKKLNGVTIEKDDILLNITGASVGRCTIIPEFLLPARVNQHVSIIRCDKEKVDAKFLLYCINSTSYKDALMSIADSGATREALTKDDIEKFQVLLPSLPLQQRIASILSAYDDLVEVNNQRIKLLEETARELYKEWFVRMRFPGYKQAKFVKGVPDGWEMKRVRDIVDRRKFGKTYKPEELSEQGNVIVIDQSTDALLGFHNNTPDHIATSESPMIIFGDHTCKMQLMIQPFSLAENVIPIAAKDGSPIYYLYYLIESLVETTEYKRHWNDLVTKSVFVCPPPLRMKYAEMIKPFFEQIEILQQQNTQLRQIRDRLLPRLISGKLEVKAQNILKLNEQD